ncbi:MAG: xanthine dehydrogenase family protein molybdopterin-binding subunit [Rhodospirillaceae bacterium]|nr:xanthine dehydrogenase family protein molybdopterin-binding subunit [Rhodospirillaceae bacterium]
MRDHSSSRMIGRRLPRREDERLLTGQGRFSDDVNVAGQCYAQFVRSPYAHATIVGIDTTDALQSPGVVAILTGDDWKADGHGNIFHVADPADGCDPSTKTFADRGGFVFDDGQPVIATEKVRHVGEPVAIVVAESVDAAKDAVERVMVDYDELPAASTIESALAENACRIWDGAPGNVCLDTLMWDEEPAVEAAFAESAHVIEGSFINNRVAGCQMEPRSGRGQYDPGTGRYFLYAGSQGSIRLKNGLMRVFGESADKVRVVSEDVGGGFGPRNFLYPDFALLAWAARRTGRSVKWTSTRGEAFLSDTQGRDNILRLALAFDDQHRFVGVKMDFLANIGAAPVSYAPVQNVARLCTSVYHVPVARARIRGVLTNTVPTGPYRGAGRPEMIHAFERLLDIYAREQGIDRIELRRRNLIPVDALPYSGRTGLSIDSGEFEKNMDMVMELADWQGFHQRRATAESAGRLRGIGLANFMEIPVGFPHETADLTVTGNGRVELTVGTQSMGMGHETVFAQVLADRLGVPLDCVDLLTGDTDRTGLGGGAHSDRSMRLVGTLMVGAAAALVARATVLASRVLEVPEKEVSFLDGGFHGGQSRHIGLFELAALLEAGDVPGLESAKLTVTEGIHDRLPAFPNGCASSEVEVDPETGEVELVRHALIHDAGLEINPMIVEGQGHGGIAQGIGQAMCENFVYEEAGAQVLSGSFMDYCLPRADDLPDFDLGSNPTAAASNPLGVKGGGEGGTTPALGAFFNALHDALAPLGIEEVPMPATPARVWELIARARAGR